jgi:hypothetical protein
MFSNARTEARRSRPRRGRAPGRHARRFEVEALESRQLMATGDVLTYHNDLARTGQYLSEKTLNPNSVTPGTFGKLFTQPVDGHVYGQPLVMANVSISGKGAHDVVFVVTEHDSVYAFDANSAGGANAKPLWKTSFIDPRKGVTTVPSREMYHGEAAITPEIGITSTPVIDPKTNTLYTLAMTKEVIRGHVQYVQKLHALDLATGREKFGAPVVIRATVRGTGVGGNGKGTIAFDARWELQRAGLVLSNGIVYVAWSSFADSGPYHGWVIGYKADRGLRRVAVYNTSPDGAQASIWQSGAAPAVDANGNLYVNTGNGDFGGRNLGDSIVKLSTQKGLKVADSFTPSKQAALNAADLDLGSSGVVLLPDQPGTAHPHLAVASSKEGTIYLVDRDHLGGYQSKDAIVQEIPGQLAGEFGVPAVYKNTVYFIDAFAVHQPHPQAFVLNGNTLSITPSFEKSDSIYGWPGATPSISADGANNGIVWAIESSGYRNNRPAVLHAYDAANLAELYNSNDTQANGSNDQAPLAVKFTVPTIAYGKVFVGGQYALSVYGLTKKKP